MLLYSLLLFGIGIALLLKSSNLLVGNAAKLAKAFGTSEFVIGVGLIAVGTSLPEFVVASIYFVGHLDHFGRFYYLFYR